MIKPLAYNLGRFALDSIASIGEVGVLIAQICRSFLVGKFRLRVLIQQIATIGMTSQPVVILTGAFTGAVLEAQSLYQLRVFHMESAGGAIVAIGMFRELGPVITGLMIAGRIGSSMAAEIGTMKVTEQVSALRSMNVDPVDYLVKPRIQAMVISMPILMMESVVIGIAAAYAVAIYSFDVQATYWTIQMEKFLGIPDIIVSITKSIAFGLLITLISCHQGLRTTGGAVGVGRSTMRAMVYSSIAILVMNFLLTMVMNQFFPIGFSKP